MMFTSLVCNHPLQERNQAAALEKKHKQIDKQITEWKSSYEQKEAECDQAAREARQYNTEVCVHVCTLYMHSLCIYTCVYACMHAHEVCIMQYSKYIGIHVYPFFSISLTLYIYNYIYIM